MEHPGDLRAFNALVARGVTVRWPPAGARPPLSARVGPAIKCAGRASESPPEVSNVPCRMPSKLRGPRRRWWISPRPGAGRASASRRPSRCEGAPPHPSHGLLICHTACRIKTPTRQAHRAHLRGAPRARSHCRFRTEARSAVPLAPCATSTGAAAVRGTKGAAAPCQALAAANPGATFAKVDVDEAGLRRGPPGILPPPFSFV
jgi:hypothetical protein